MKCLPLLVLYILPYVSYTQSFSKHWDKRFGGTSTDAAISFIATKDGGYLLGGWSTSNIGGDKTQDAHDNNLGDYWVVKLDGNGNKIWDKRFGGDDGEVLNEIREVSDGYVLAGLSGSNDNFEVSQPSRGIGDYWIVKIDFTGEKIWDRRYGGSGNEILYDIQQTFDNGFIIGGISASPANGDKTEPNWSSMYDYWIVKVDSNGNKQWDKRYGGTDDEWLQSIIQTPDSGFLIGGYSYSDSSGNKPYDNFDPIGNDPDGWLIKTDKTGGITWSKRLGAASSDGVSIVSIDKDGNYIVASNTGPGSSVDKVLNERGGWILKFDTNGDKLWEIIYPELIAVSNMELMPDGGYLLMGLSHYDIQGIKTENNLGDQQNWFLRVDSQGQKIWDKTILLEDDAWDGDAVIVDDNCFAVFTGTKYGIGGNNSNTNWDPSGSTFDYWIMKFCMNPVGIEDVTDKMQIQIYPNPTADDISISIQQINLQSATFTLTNALGKVIYRRKETGLADSYTKSLDLRNLPSGSYFVTVYTGGETVVKQVVKE